MSDVHTGIFRLSLSFAIVNKDTMHAFAHSFLHMLGVFLIGRDPNVQLSGNVVCSAKGIQEDSSCSINPVTTTLWNSKQVTSSL